MAYLVIAVGLLTSLVGGYLLNYGYAIVQVERGWSSVIAGSVFVTGGLVTMGLGLVLRAVTDVLRDLVGAGAGRPAVFAAPAAVAPPFAPREPKLYADGAMVRGPGGEEGDALPVPSPVEPERARAIPAHDAGVHADGAHPDEAHVAETGAATLPLRNEAAEVEVAGAVADDAYPAPTAREAEPPAMDDWLDRAFSEIDGASPPSHPEPKRDGDAAQPHHEAGSTRVEPEAPPDAGPPHGEPAQREAAYAEAEAHPAMTTPATTAPAAPDIAPSPPHDSPVIGRYESDDTSYVMYADGSIEAQSPAGIYRFSSMAELKAFIEG